MKVSLIVPQYLGGKYFLQQPYDFLIVYNMLKNCPKVKIKILDNRILKLSNTELLKRIETSEIIVVTTAPYDIVNVVPVDHRLYHAIHVIKTIKTSFPHKKVFVVSAHGTLNCKEIIELTKADGVIIGEYEKILIEIINKGTNLLDKIPNLCFNKEDKIFFTTRDPNYLMDFNNLRITDFSPLEMKKYFGSLLIEGKLEKIYNWSVTQASRGCPFNCRFCLNFFGKKVRLRKVKNVIEELLILQDIGINNVFFIDSIFGLDKKWLDDFVIYFEKEKLHVNTYIQTRADFINDEYVEKLKLINCKFIWFGTESLNNSTLSHMNKGLTEDDIKKAVNTLKKHSINAGTWLILGYPGQTMDEINSSLEYFKKNNIAVNTILFNPFKSFYLGQKMLKRYFQSLYDLKGNCSVYIRKKDIAILYNRQRYRNTAKDFSNYEFINNYNKDVPFISFPLTKACTFKCFYCGEGGEGLGSRKDYWEVGELMEVISELKKLGIKKIRFTGGEPFLYSKLGILLKFVSDIDMFTLVNSNGSLIIDKPHFLYGINKNIQFAISLDSLNKTTFRTITSSKIPLGKVLEGIYLLRTLGNLLRINTVVTNINIEEVLKIIDFCLKNKINLKILSVVSVPKQFHKHQEFFVSLMKIKEYVEKLSTEKYLHKYSQKYGVPMTIYRVKDIFIHIRDHSIGSHYDLDYICRDCPLFPCDEGLYDIFVFPDKTVWSCRWKRINKYNNLLDNLKFAIDRFQHARLLQKL